MRMRLNRQKFEQERKRDRDDEQGRMMQIVREKRLSLEDVSVGTHFSSAVKEFKRKSLGQQMAAE